LRLWSESRWRTAISSRARRFVSIRTWEYLDSMARDTRPAMLMITSSPAPDSASSVTSVWRLSCHALRRPGRCHAPSVFRPNSIRADHVSLAGDRRITRSRRPIGSAASTEFYRQQRGLRPYNGGDSTAYPYISKKRTFDRPLPMQRGVWKSSRFPSDSMKLLIDMNGHASDATIHFLSLTGQSRGALG
jgi:hypothetical protein